MKTTIRSYLENRNPSTYGKKIIILKGGKNCGTVLENLNAEIISVKVTTKWIFIEVK